jgi:hypothetical protein
LLVVNIAAKYQQAPNDSLETEIIFTILFAAMVAEENKANTRLGAKIKRLGVHQVLMDTPPISSRIAANYSRGMKWQEINKECSDRGF